MIFTPDSIVSYYVEGFSIKQLALRVHRLDKIPLVDAYAFVCDAVYSYLRQEAHNC